jgi:hypothetical protein
LPETSGEALYIPLFIAKSPDKAGTIKLNNSPEIAMRRPEQLCNAHAAYSGSIFGVKSGHEYCTVENVSIVRP